MNWVKYSTCIVNCTFFLRLIFHLQHLLKCTKRNNNKFPGKRLKEIEKKIIHFQYIFNISKWIRLCCMSKFNYQKNSSYCYALSFLFYRIMRYLYICYCIRLMYFAIRFLIFDNFVISNIDHFWRFELLNSDKNSLWL